MPRHAHANNNNRRTSFLVTAVNGSIKRFDNVEITEEDKLQIKVSKETLHSWEGMLGYEIYSFQEIPTLQELKELKERYFNND